MAAQVKSRFTHQFSRHPQPLYAQPRAELLCVLQVNKLARVGEQQSKKFDDFKRFLERGGPPDAVPHLSLSSFIRPYLTMSLSLNSLFCLTMCRSSTGPTWGTTRSGRSRASRSATCRCGHRPAPVTVRIALRLPRLLSADTATPADGSSVLLAPQVDRVVKYLQAQGLRPLIVMHSRCARPPSAPPRACRAAHPAAPCRQTKKHQARFRFTSPPPRSDDALGAQALWRAREHDAAGGEGGRVLERLQPHLPHAPEGALPRRRARPAPRRRLSARISRPPLAEVHLLWALNARLRAQMNDDWFWLYAGVWGSSKKPGLVMVPPTPAPPGPRGAAGARSWKRRVG